MPGAELSPEDNYHMQGLFLKMKAVEDKQNKLQDAVDADTRKVMAVHTCSYTHYAYNIAQRVHGS